MTTEDTRWVENRPTHGRRGIDLPELWRYRELVWFLALRDIKVRYKQAALGMVWAVLQPLVGAAVFTFVFRRVAKVDSGDIPYLVFAFSGFMAWTYVSRTITVATDSLVQNASLITKVYFPRLAAPLAATIPGLLDVAVSAVVLLAMMVWYRIAPGVQIVLAPVAMLQLVVLAFGVGLFLSTLEVRYRDADHATALMLQVWLFISPVAYPAQLVTGPWKVVYELNPMVGALGLLRWALFGGELAVRAELLALGVTGLALVIGAVYFLRAERRFADII
jgi:ABC-type polysaccharide/polyol phosphate export permease